MISAIEQQRRQERDRNGAAATGIGAGAPSFAAILDMLSLATLNTTAACIPQNQATQSQSTQGQSTQGQSTQSDSTPAATAGLDQYVGQSVGTGQCVALVRAANPSLGPAATWSPGAPVAGNAALQPGTPIATFDGGRYANATDGTSHAAIYLGQDASGLTVLDQWSGHAAAIRTIPWQNTTPANTATAYRVIRPT